MTTQWKQAGAWWGGTVSAVAFSPHFETDRLALAATLAGVYRSLDGGRSWAFSSAGLDELATHTLVFAPAGPADPLAAFTATQQGRLYCSLDGGASWESLNSWRYGTPAAIAVSPHYPADGTLFVATSEGIFRSFERGLKWQSANFGLLDTDVLCLACAPDFAASELLWAGTAGGGFYCSRNAGRAWREEGFGLPDSAIQCLAVSPAFAEDQTLFAGTETAGLFRSRDGGHNWEAVGLAGQSVNCLALFHATAPNANGVLLAGTSAGVFISGDGGEAWTPAHAGPAAPLTLATAGPGYALAGSYQEGLALSEDGGRSWRPSLEGLAAHVPPLVVSRPGAPAAEDEELIAAAFDAGLVHSHDGGLTWQRTPLDSTEAETFPAQALAAAGNSGFVATSDQLHHSQAVGSGWVELPLPHEETLPTLLAISPFKENQKLLLGTQGGRLYLADAESVHWQSIPTPLAEAGLLLQAAFSFEPATANPSLHLVTAAQAEPHGFKLQLWQTADEGASWQELVAIAPAKTAAAALLIPDPAKGFPLFLAVQNEIIKLAKETAGSTLAGSHATLPEGLAITTLAASPGYRVNRTLLAGTNKGVFHSRDEGESWQPLGQGLESRAVVALLPSVQTGLTAVTLGGEVWRLVYP